MTNKLSNVDYHSHILPRLDDGSESLEESLGMAKAAVEVGFETVIATPHYETYYYKNDREIVLQAVAAFQKAVGEAGIPLAIEPGSEVMLGPEIPDLLAQNKLMTMQDKKTHLLVELPFSTCPLWVDDVIYRLQLQGITLIMAHPERYLWLGKDLEWLIAKRENGMQLQGNIGSLKGKYGHGVQTRIEQLYRHGLIDLWGSDAHSVRGYQIITAP